MSDMPETATSHRSDMSQNEMIPKMTVNLFYQQNPLISNIFLFEEFLIQMSEMCSCQITSAGLLQQAHRKR